MRMMLPNFRSSRINIRHFKTMTQHLSLEDMLGYFSIHRQFKDDCLI